MAEPQPHPDDDADWSPDELRIAQYLREPGAVRIRNHLYDPVADRWFALPQPPTVAPPDADRPDAEDPLSWNPAIPGTMCADPGPGECWELVTVVLSVVAHEVKR